MCQNEYRSSECAIKSKDIHDFESTTTLAAQLESFTKQLPITQLAQANVSQI